MPLDQCRRDKDYHAHEAVSYTHLKLPHLFDRFYRVDESRTGGEGFGLGLAIAQSIVQTHGGSIGCTSAEGITRFTVTLPLLKNDSVKRGQEGC